MTDVLAGEDVEFIVLSLVLMQLVFEEKEDYLCVVGQQQIGFDLNHLLDVLVDEERVGEDSLQEPSPFIKQ